MPQEPVLRPIPSPQNSTTSKVLRKAAIHIDTPFIVTATERKGCSLTDRRLPFSSKKLFKPLLESLETSAPFFWFPWMT